MPKKKPEPAPEPRSPLPDFEGLPVVKSLVRITRAGDGLSEALDFEPVALHHGDLVFFVLKGVVAQVNHRPDGKTDAGDVEELTRQHTITATDIALVEEGDVAELLGRNAERVGEMRRQAEAAEQARVEAEAGIMKLPGTGTGTGTGGDDEEDEAEVLERQHAAGVHADGLRDGCPSCAEEARLDAAGQ